jgi:hypothetical protein
MTASTNSGKFLQARVKFRLGANLSVDGVQFIGGLAHNRAEICGLAVVRQTSWRKAAAWVSVYRQLGRTGLPMLQYTCGDPPFDDRRQIFKAGTGRCPCGLVQTAHQRDQSTWNYRRLSAAKIGPAKINAS